MAKTLRYTFLLLLALVAFAALASVFVIPASLASADAIVYVDASLSFDGEALSGTAEGHALYTVLPFVWVSDDGVVWRKAPAELETQLVYLQGESPLATAPTTAGLYTVELRVVQTGGVAYTRFADGVAVDGNTVLTSMSYRVADVNANVLVGPGTDLSYTGNDQYSSIAAATRVYNAGTLVDSDQYTIVVSKGGEVVDKVQQVGEYTVTVTYLGNAYTATFSVVKKAADAIRLADTVIYDGMYSVAEYQAQRDAYYRLSFAGALSDNGALDATYAYAVYMQNDKVLAAPPTQAGDYVCRVVIKADHALGLHVGDYIDLPYTIRPVPYLPIYTADNGTPVLGDSYAEHCYRYSTPFNINVSQFVLTADNGHIIQMNIAARQCYRYDGTDWTAVDQVTGVGMYKCVYTIDYGTGITGKFGVNNASYRVDQYNCVFEYPFQVIGSYSVSGVKRTYNALAEINSDTSITKLNPQIKYDGVLATTGVEGVIQYTYKLNGVEVSIDDIKTQRTVGQYVGVATFRTDWEVAGKKVALKDEQYQFGFSITVPRYSVGTAKQVATLEAAKDIVKNLYTDYGVAESSVTYSYYWVANGIYNSGSADYCASQNAYRIDAAVVDGKYAGSVFSVDFVKTSDGHKEDIVFEIAGMTGNTAAYSGNWYIAAIDQATTAHCSDYTLYYQKKFVNGAGDVSWSICNYPTVVGQYRAVMRFDKANAYFDAAYGDVVTFEYAITPQTLRAAASISGDGVFDGLAKTVQYTFYIDGRPVDATEVYRRTKYSGADAIKLYYANNAVSSTLYKVHSETNKLSHAGTYGVALLLCKGDFSSFGLSTLSLEDETETVQVRNTEYPYFMRAGSVTIAKLQLDVEVTIPVGYKALYPEDGVSIVPTYRYFKGNDNNGDELTGTVQSHAVVNYTLKYKSPGALVADSVDKAVEAGDYTHQLVITSDNVGDGSGVDYTKDVVFGRIVQKYNGAVAGEEYAVDAATVPGSGNLRMTVGYRISPLPLNVSYAALSTAFQQVGEFYQAYYGEVFKVSLSDISFSTVDVETGASKNIDHSFDVSLVVKKRLSGNSTTLGVIDSSAYETLSDYKVFVAGSYTLSVVFGAPRNSAEQNLYAHYRLTNGQNVTEMGTLQEDSRFDVMFDVLAAEKMRVVFNPMFESYSFNGNAKNFDIRFMVGRNDVTDNLAGSDYSIAYYRREGNSYTTCRADEVTGTDGSTVQYRVTVLFNRTLFHYAVEQYPDQGEYSASDSPYIPKNATVEYEFSVVKSGVLAWGWSQGGDYVGPSQLAQGLTYYYNGQATPLSVRFVAANVYADTATPINMDKGTDYDIWFYRSTDDGWVKMATAPVTPGTYVAELVFMRDIADYRTGEDYNYVYSYLHAEQSGGFGRSLMNHGEMYEALKSENRFVQINIAKPIVVLTSMSAQDKDFDGLDTATISRVNISSYTVSGNVALDANANPLWQLLQRPIVGIFEYAGVGQDLVVIYCIKVAEGLLLPLPHSGTIGATEGVQYMLQQLQTLQADAASKGQLTDAVAASLQQIDTLLRQLAEYYDFRLVDVSASIKRAAVKILADDFTRTYNPDFDDTGKLTYSLSVQDLTLLRSLSVAGLDNALAKDYFVGSLVRSDANNAAINDKGYPIVLGADFAFIDAALRLVDHRVVEGVSESTLAQNIDITINNALYYIKPCHITVSAALSVTDSHNNVTLTDISRSYNEEDPAITYYVVKGSLLFMDELVYVDNEGNSGNGCNLYYQRTHDGNKLHDDVGVYDVLYGNVRVYRYGQDVTDNYVIDSVAKTFEITPMQLVLMPVFKDTYHMDDVLEPTDVGVQVMRVTVDKYGIEKTIYESFTDLADVYHAKVSATFRREEVANNDEHIYKCYNVLLGTSRVITTDGADVTKNYTFVLSPATQQLVVSKYEVLLSVNVGALTKKFGEPDPAVQLSFHRDKNPNGFTIAEGSAPSRQEGEDVGSYHYISTNQGTITILNEEGEDVTRYCYIAVYEGSQLLSDLQLTIEALPVTVTVRSETVYKTGKTIIPSIIFLGENGAVVSSAITSKIKSKFVVDDVMSQLNNEKEVDEIRLKPRMAEGSPIDDNFLFTYAEGTLTVIYPWNVLSVETVATDSSVAQANRFAMVGGVLYKTVQLYAVSTMDGGRQTRTMSIKLPVTDSLIEEDVYLVSVHYDGSYVMCDAVYSDGNIVVSDDQFTYVLAVQPMYWPYYVGALFVVLVIIAVIAIVLRSKKREKVRGKKPKKERVKKQREPRIKPSKEAPTQPDSEESESTQDETSELPQEQEEQPTQEQEAPRRGKKKKNKRNEEVPTVGPIVPMAPTDDDTLPPMATDGSGSSDSDNSGDDGDDGVPPLPEDDDEEIVINTVTRRVSDDEDDGRS